MIALSSNYIIIDIRLSSDHIIVDIIFWCLAVYSIILSRLAYPSFPLCSTTSIILVPVVSQSKLTISNTIQYGAILIHICLVIYHPSSSSLGYFLNHMELYLICSITSITHPSYAGLTCTRVKCPEGPHGTVVKYCCSKIEKLFNHYMGVGGYLSKTDKV